MLSPDAEAKPEKYSVRQCYWKGLWPREFSIPKVYESIIKFARMSGYMALGADTQASPIIFREDCETGGEYDVGSLRIIPDPVTERMAGLEFEVFGMARGTTTPERAQEFRDFIRPFIKTRTIFSALLSLLARRSS